MLFFFHFFFSFFFLIYKHSRTRKIMMRSVSSQDSQPDYQPKHRHLTSKRKVHSHSSSRPFDTSLSRISSYHSGQTPQKKYLYFSQFINLLFYFKIFIIILGIFSIFLRIYDFVTSTSSDSLINNIDYLNYIAVLILVLISSVYIVFIYNKKYDSIIKEMHRKIYQTFSITTFMEIGNQNDILESLIFWMFIYFIILVFSILVSKFTKNLNYTTELL